MAASRGTPALTPAGFQVLLALAAGYAHGYAVGSFIEEVTDGRVRLGPGTLYRTLARLVADELVTETDDRDPSAPHDTRRRYYQLTALGEQTVRAEAEMLGRLVDAARDNGVFGSEIGGPG